MPVRVCRDGYVQARDRVRGVEREISLTRMLSRRTICTVGYCDINVIHVLCTNVIQLNASKERLAANTASSSIVLR